MPATAQQQAVIHQLQVQSYLRLSISKLLILVRRTRNRRRTATKKANQAFNTAAMATALAESLTEAAREESKEVADLILLFLLSNSK
ncbi:hypothetical protein HDU98_005974 [Podochytrium sp. JEL0797]|nr:hypothetical protein HDU98_005974 [Podochytrium sp. JEL0797]